MPACRPRADGAGGRLPEPKTFAEVVALFAPRGARASCTRLLLDSVHLVRFEPGRIEIHAPAAPRDLADRG